VFHRFLGKITVNGKSAAVNKDFASQAIFLSQELDCSERYVAGVLHHVMSENPNIGPVQCMELTVATFHQRRRDLVDSLRFLLEATEASELPDAPTVYQRLGTFVKAELLFGPRSGASEPTMARKVFKEIEQLDDLIGKADAARKNAGSNTVVPSGQGEQ
jgi:nuclear pore complex protein Nup205